MIFIILGFAGYYLLPSAQANNFPTYFSSLVTIYFILFIRQHTAKIFHSLVFLLSALIVLYLASSGLWSSDYEQHDIVSLLGNSALVMCLLLSLQIVKGAVFTGARPLLSAWVLAATVSAAIYLIQSLTLATTDNILLPIGRWNTAAVASIGYGLGLVISCFLISQTQHYQRLFWLICTGLLFFACLKLETGYVWFALICALTILSFGKILQLRESPLVIIWMLVSVLLIAALVLTFDTVLDSNRQLIWHSVMDTIYMTNPAIGKGILTQVSPQVDCGSAASILSNFADCSFKHPHNLFVATTYYGGIVALALLLMLYLTAISVLVESSDINRWLIMSMLGYGAAIFIFDGDQLVGKINFVWLVFWLPIGLTIALELEGKYSDQRQ
ncbi:MAG: hypothetical protein KUG79_10065 [Pseudomonadales bacterium]|nr:hypothetical protein [Pseudomonadales bacterium]